jgi:hypothetical protein
VIIVGIVVKKAPVYTGHETKPETYHLQGFLKGFIDGIVFLPQGRIDGGDSLGKLIIPLLSSA